MKKLLFLLFITIILLCTPKTIRAVGEFRADYDVDYNVSPGGSTIVTQTISLTNKITNLYPTKYTILIDTEKIHDVIAYDRKGEIHPTIAQHDGKTEINVTFNDQVVGVGNTLTFTLRFTNDDIAQKNGAIWEVNIPGITADPDIGSYSTSLSVPASFGPAAYFSPPPADGKKWNKAQMTSGGVSAAFGQIQAFSLHLSYFLQNNNITPGVTEIALPPDTDFQKIVLQSIDPKPKSIFEDADGNWLAQYSLSPGQKINVDVIATAFMTLDPRPEYGTTIITPQDYTRPLKYWEADDPTIVTLAKNLRTPRAIYDYVVKTLSYDYNRVNSSPMRKGAKAALASPKQAICMEFTDLFIAIARAAGIPAREVVGFAYTTNSRLRPLSLVADVLHAWPEYFDDTKQIWVPVDPTWANTTGGVDYFSKLDFNHIAFAIHGRDSELPYAAGFYKEPGTNTKDVSVSFAEVPAVLPTAGKLDTSFQFPDTIPAGFVTKGGVDIENSGNVAVNSVSVSVSAPALDVDIHRTNVRIPPLGNLTIPLEVSIPDFLRSGTGVIVASVNERVTNHYVTIQPAWIVLVPFVIGVLLIAVGLWYIIGKRSLWKLRKR